MQKGFTLAEFLITLGIIGIVTAITIPGLLQNTRDRQNITHWKKSYSILSQVFKDASANNIPIEWNDEFFNFFKSKVEVIDSCGDSEDACMGLPLGDKNKAMKHRWCGIYGSGSVYSLLYKPDIKLNSYNLRNEAMLLKDGSVVYFGLSLGGPWISVDVNNAQNGPNQVGRDFFIMKYMKNSDELLPLGADGTFNTAGNGEKCLCGKEYGAQTSANYFVYYGGTNEVISGGCCSDYYIKNDK